MQAMVAGAWGEPEDLRLVELPDPEPKPRELVIEVKTSGCNFFDILMVQGKYQVRPSFPFAPGSEIAGVVRSVGSDVRRFSAGDRVYANIGWGGYASVALAPEEAAYKIPATMPFEHGAAFGIVYQTSYFGLVHRAGIRPAETLLVHAAAGGVGLAAVQIGRALGARVLAAVGSREKLALPLEQGAEKAFLYDSADWVEEVKAATDGRGADVIYDPVGGDVFDLSTKCIAFEGRLIVVGFASGRIPSIQANRILLKNIAIIGLHWGAYRLHDPQRISHTMEVLFDLYEQGKVTPVVSAVYSLEEAARALREIASRRSVGKVVLRP